MAKGDSHNGDRRSDRPLVVEVPSSESDKPGWAKVGIIAVVGFVVGIAWPRLVGVRLGPAAPGESAAAAASGATSAGRAPDAPPASVTKPITSAAASAAPATPASAAPPTTAAPPNISVQRGTVISCKTADGETKKGKDCGLVPGIDQLVSPRVRKIATCSGVEGQTGKLVLVVHADFDSGRFSYDVAKASTLPNLDAVTACLKTSFHGTSTTATPHEHTRYTVSYNATFAPATAGGGDDDATAKKGDKAADKSERSAKDVRDDKSDKTEKPEKSDAPGEASVAWEVALVRDAPKTGSLLSRLPRGTKVKVGATKDGWFQIKYGEGFASEGWVYRGAIGR